VALGAGAVSAAPLADLSRCAVHTITTKPWSLRQCIDGYRAAGIPGITVWRQWLAPQGARESARMLADSGLSVVSLCRGGFFPARDQAGRLKAIDDNRKAIDEAAEIGAPMVVLVCGAVPGMPLEEARAQIADGIAACLPHARERKVKLAIEPLHPQYAADRSAVVTMRQAREICERVGDPLVGIAVDVYHIWWDQDLEAEIAAAGRAGRIFAFHTCDWKVQQRDPLNDRGLMGEGCIDLRRIRGWVERAGFTGWVEVEVFSETHWAREQTEFLRDIVGAYRAHA
jgi:sugar phosphate isomerase/epimerase